MPIEEPIFDLRGGVVQLGADLALKGVDFSLRPGEFVALLGANGSGKTTLIKTLLGLVRLSQGRLSVFGRGTPTSRDQRRIGYVPQRFGATSGVPASVREVVLSGRVSHKRWFERYDSEDAMAARGALDAVGLAHRASDGISTLSGGQQQRVLIARALATEPEVLILDEPMAGVDIEHQESFARTLALVQHQGKTVLLAAHELGAVEGLVRRTVVLDAGLVSYDGVPLAHQVSAAHAHHHPHASSR